MATKNIKKILLNKDGDNFVADIENIENRITQNSSNLETAKQELSNKCNKALSEAKAYTDQEKAKYLPLTGGNVTGAVTINNNLTVTGTVTSTFNGNLTGDVVGNVTGNLTGSATKATNADNLGGYPASDYIRSENFGGGGLGGGGLEIGDIALAPLGIDETDNCRRYLNGQVILQSQFSKFTEKLKHAITLYPNLSTTETNWQSAVTLSPLGQCGKFVIDDEAGTIRLPKVVNVMGALDLSTIGQTVEAGLPNITGSIGTDVPGNGNVRMVGGGAFTPNTSIPSVNILNTTSSSKEEVFYTKYNFNASLSSSVYNNSTTVQQEAIKYPYFIQVATSNNEDVQIDTQVRLNNPFSLFMPYWSPIELNNLSWLRSNKQWNNRSVYTSAYEFLLSKYNAGTEQTETIKGVSVTYKLADNGMKIITDKSKYDALISASGSAWFFVLDTKNTQFILPYTNGFAQFGSELGKFTEAGLPNITGVSSGNQDQGHSLSGAFYLKQMRIKNSGGDSFASLEGFDASRCSPIYGNSETVQPNSVTGYLYFYVGEVEQDANIIATSGLAESVSRKADNDLSNVTAPAQAFKNMSIGWGMPDWSASILVTSTSGEFTYTAPSNGFVWFNSTGSTTGTVTINGTKYIVGGNDAYNEGPEFIPLSKNDNISASNDASRAYFIPCKGAN